METKKRFRPLMRHLRILEAIAIEFKKNGDRAIRLNWFLIALNLVLASSNLFMYFFN